MIFGIFIGLLIGLVLAYLFMTSGSGGKKKKSKNDAKLKKTSMVVGLFVVVFAIGIYALVGRPDLVNPPKVPDSFSHDLFTDQGPDQLPPIDIMVERLKARLEEDPGDVEGWSLLGQSLLIMGNFDEAVDAYQQAIALMPNNADLHSALGEAIVLRADGIVTEAAVYSFENALAIDPDEPISRFYLGDFAFQQGDFQLAYDRWLEVYNFVPPETPWLDFLEQRLRDVSDRLGIDPPAPKVATSSGPQGQLADDIRDMSQEDQNAMIEGMVAQLAARLEDNPDDLEGWARLGRSYMVLGRFQEGAKAYKKVADAMPDEIAAQEQYAQALLTWQQSEGLPVDEEALTVLNKLLEMDGNSPTALFYLGQAAAESGDNDLARQYWGKLLSLMGPNSEDAQLVQEKLDSLE